MSAFHLKVVAVVTMFVDHLAAIVIAQNHEYPWFYMRHFGRVAFPVFAFLIAVGCVHSKDIKKYMLRLGCFALISEVVYDMAFSDTVDFFDRTNIFYTLFLGVACIAVFKHVKSVFRASVFSENHWLLWVCAVLTPLPFVGAAEILSTDYAGAGVVLIYAFYVFNPNNRFRRLLVLILGMAWLYMVWMDWAIMFWFSLLSVPFVLVYNGKAGLSHRVLKWGFYVFYPVHLVVLVML